MILCHIRNAFGTGKIISSYENGHMLCISRQKYTFFRGRISTSYDKYFFSCKKFSVTGRTICNTMSLELIFSFESNFSRMCSCREKDSKTGKLSSVCNYFFHISCQIKPCRFCKHKFCSKSFCLLTHSFCQILPTGFKHTGKIYHLRGYGNLSSKTFLFHNQHTIFCTGKVNCCSKPRRTSANDNYVI